MKKLTLGLFALVLLALPQLAGAQSQSFGGDYKYVAKFLCGALDDEEQGIGVIQGHYNTVINVLSLKNKTAIAYRATWLAEETDECDFSQLIDRGVPSDFSERFDLDRDGAIAIGCYEIKSSLIGRCSGFFEGMVTIYSSRPLAVTDVITGQGDGDQCDGNCPLSVMQVYQVNEVKTSEKITPSVQQVMQNVAPSAKVAAK